jgi:hypothetical protein
VGRGVDILHSGLLFVVCVQGGGVEIKFAPFKQFVPISLCQLTTAISLSRLGYKEEGFSGINSHKIIKFYFFTPL